MAMEQRIKAKGKVSVELNIDKNRLTNCSMQRKNKKPPGAENYH